MVLPKGNRLFPVCLMATLSKDWVVKQREPRENSPSYVLWALHQITSLSKHRLQIRQVLIVGVGLRRLLPPSLLVSDVRHSFGVYTDK